MESGSFNGTQALFGHMHSSMKLLKHLKIEKVMEFVTVSFSSKLKSWSKIHLSKNSVSSLHTYSRMAWLRYHLRSSSIQAEILGLKRKDFMELTSTRHTNQYSSSC
jgi:hypothetical protein